MTNIHFDPAVIDSIESGDSVAVTVSIEVPEGLLPGDYFGELMAMESDGDPSVRVPVVLHVASGSDIGFDNNPVVGDRDHSAS